MILTDTGILIAFLRTKDAKLGHLLGTRPIAICGAVRSEVLAGVRNPTELQKTLAFLKPFAHVPMPETSWDHVGASLAALYAVGISVPFPDALIATLGIENDIEVWARDPHFVMMQKALPALKLFQEPP
jgi:predicted nucleic acid-binding protein